MASSSVDVPLSVPSPDLVLGPLVAFRLVDFSLSVSGPAWLLEPLVPFLLLDVSLSVLDLHVGSLAAFPVVDVSV